MSSIERRRPLSDGDWRLTKYSMGDFALSRVALFRPLGSGGSSSRQSVQDMMVSGGGKAVADQMEFDDPCLGPVRIGFTSLPVGAREEDLLLVIMALAGMSGTKASPKRLVGGPRSAVDDQRDQQMLFAKAVEVMRTEGDALKGSLYIIKVPQSLLVQAWRGRRGTGSDYSDLVDSMQRLMSISYTVAGIKGNRRWTSGQSGLISFEAVEEPAEDQAAPVSKGRRPAKNLQIVLSERMARVILGWERPAPAKGRKNPDGASKHFVKVIFAERFALEGDLARLVHRYLSSVVNEPKTRKAVTSPAIKLSTITRAIWGPHPEPTLEARLAKRDPAAAEARLAEARQRHAQEVRDRRAALRELAFAPINQLAGWKIAADPEKPVDDPAVIVTRTKTSDSPARPPGEQLQGVLGLAEKGEARARAKSAQKDRNSL